MTKQFQSVAVKSVTNQAVSRPQNRHIHNHPLGTLFESAPKGGRGSLFSTGRAGAREKSHGAGQGGLMQGKRGNNWGMARQGKKCTN